MPITMVKVNALPKPTRHKRRTMEGTSEWREARERIDAGLKKGDGFFVTFTPEQARKLGLKEISRTFKTMVREYVSRNELPYDVWRYRSNGTEVVAVAMRKNVARAGKRRVA